MKFIYLLIILVSSISFSQERITPNCYSNVLYHMDFSASIQSTLDRFNYTDGQKTFHQSYINAEQEIVDLIMRQGGIGTNKHLFGSFLSGIENNTIHHFLDGNLKINKHRLIKGKDIARDLITENFLKRSTEVKNRQHRTSQPPTQEIRQASLSEVKRTLDRLNLLMDSINETPKIKQGSSSTQEKELNKKNHDPSIFWVTQPTSSALHIYKQVNKNNALFKDFFNNEVIPRSNLSFALKFGIERHFVLPSENKQKILILQNDAQLIAEANWSQDDKEFFIDFLDRSGVQVFMLVLHDNKDITQQQLSELVPKNRQYLVNINSPDIYLEYKKQKALMLKDLKRVLYCNQA